MREVLDRLTSELVEACRGRLTDNDRLRGVVLYGSVARGTMHPGPDIDVLVVAEPLPSGRLPRMDEFAAEDRSMEPALADARFRGVDTRV